MTDFAFNKILLRYFKFLFHLEYPYFFNTLCTFWPNSILFQGLENQFWNSILFQQYRVGALTIYCKQNLTEPVSFHGNWHCSNRQMRGCVGGTVHFILNWKINTTLCWFADDRGMPSHIYFHQTLQMGFAFILKMFHRRCNHDCQDNRLRCDVIASCMIQAQWRHTR